MTDPAREGRELFLRLVDEFPASARELVHTWHALSRREQDLALLDLQRRRPGLDAGWCEEGHRINDCGGDHR